VASNNERFAVLVYVAGWRGRRTDNTLLAEELASQGFVVAAIDDVSVNMRPGAELSAPWAFSSREDFDRTRAAAAAKVTLEARMASAVLDGLTALDANDPDGRFTRRLDLKRAGVMGFSFGGAVAAEACRRDQRFRAAANLDGYLWGAASTDGINQPYFLANTEEPETPAPASALAEPDPATGFLDELNLIDEPHQLAILKHTRGFRLVITDTSHMDLTDDPFFSVRYRLTGRLRRDPLVIVKLLSTYTAAFFEMALNGTPPGPPLVGAPPDPGTRLVTFR